MSLSSRHLVDPEVAPLIDLFSSFSTPDMSLDEQREQNDFRHHTDAAKSGRSRRDGSP